MSSGDVLLCEFWGMRDDTDREISGGGILSCSEAVAIIGYRDPVSDETLIAEAGRRLSKAAPHARVILFGSHARGEAQPGSDLDLLVVEPELKSRRAEFVRLREALGAMGVPIDLIVVSADHAERWGPVPGTLMHEALRDGRVIAGA
jgi:predicted nucleotidyltransferase